MDKEGYHFTFLNRVYGIGNKGLVPRIGVNSKAIGDNIPKVSYSEGELAAIGLVADFYCKYENIHRKGIDKKVDVSNSFEDYFGSGVYFVFDAENIKNTGGNKGHINPFDAGTTQTIPSENLIVCGIRNIENPEEVSYERLDFINYCISQMTESDIIALRNLGDKGYDISKLEEYKESHKAEIDKYKNGKYEKTFLSLDEFVKIYESSINKDIREYLEEYSLDVQEDISKIKQEIQSMPDEIKKLVDDLENEFYISLDKKKNGDLRNLDIPLPEFYEQFRQSLDKFFKERCESIIEDDETNKEFSKLSQEIDNMEEYKDLFLHSAHHIKNVVQFAYIIGKCENTLGEDFDLLIQAAKYHDSGREESEWYSDNHADSSAEKAAEKLKDDYTPEQIAMIKVAIRYHEHSEKFKNVFDEEYFKEICKKEGVPEEKLNASKLICIYLKDADALDRVRLGNLDTSYLRTCTAKSDFFIREFDKSKDDIDWDNAGFAVKRNKDFSFNQELLKALQKLKEYLRDELKNGKKSNQIILDAIEKIEGNPEYNIDKIIKKVKHVLQIEKSGNKVCDNCEELYGIKSSAERKEKYLKLAVERFQEASLDMLELRLADVIRLSEIPRKEYENYDVSIESVDTDIKVGMNDNKKVTYKAKDGSLHSGYFKENIIPVFNDTSIAVARIGELLNVNMAETYPCEYEGKKGIISKDVADGFSNSNEKFIMMREVINEVKMPRIDISNSEKAKPTQYIPYGMLKDKAKITEMFEYPLEALDKFGINKEDKDEFIKEYVKMICFDYFTNQTDRNEGNFGILKKGGRIKFAPLIDCDYVLHDISDKDNDINFINSIRCDRNILMEVISEKYPEIVQDFVKNIENNKENIDNILQNSFSDDMYKKYNTLLQENLEYLESLTYNYGEGSGRFLEKKATKETLDGLDIQRNDSEINKEKNNDINLDDFPPAILDYLNDMARKLYNFNIDKQKLEVSENFEIGNLKGKKSIKEHMLLLSLDKIKSKYQNKDKKKTLKLSDKDLSEKLIKDDIVNVKKGMEPKFKYTKYLVQKNLDNVKSIQELYLKASNEEKIKILENLQNRFIEMEKSKGKTELDKKLQIDFSNYLNELKMASNKSTVEFNSVEEKEID